MSSKTWIVVADGFLGRLFRLVEGQEGLIEVETLANPEGRLHDTEIISDAYGRSGGGDTYEDRRKEHDVVRDTFARDIIHNLEKHRTRGELEKLYLVAEPRFLGLLRSHMKKELSQCLEAEVAHDLVKHSNEKIRKALPSMT